MLVLGKLLGRQRIPADGTDCLVGNAVYRYHMDYRKVNRLDEREKFENSL
jgi:hypothetical protein